MQLSEQLKEIQKTILQLERSRDYYKKQFEASILENVDLVIKYDTLYRLFLIVSSCTFVVISICSYFLLIIK